MGDATLCHPEIRLRRFTSSLLLLFGATCDRSSVLKIFDHFHFSTWPACVTRVVDRGNHFAFAVIRFMLHPFLTILIDVVVPILPAYSSCIRVFLLVIRCLTFCILDIKYLLILIDTKYYTYFYFLYLFLTFMLKLTMLTKFILQSTLKSHQSPLVIQSK